MTIVTNNLDVTLEQAAAVIASVGATRTVMLRGQPGIGKSSIRHILQRMLPEYFLAYVDCAGMDFGDIGMLAPNRDKGVMEFLPNPIFGIFKGQDKPVILLLDEISKAPKPVMNMLLPMLGEGRIGDKYLPTGSIRCATGNLETDGVGDNFPAHVCNRMINLVVANPTSEQWLGWAAENGIHPVVMNFAREFPQVFERYDQLDNKSSNPYIFNPTRGVIRTFCSPRSLEAASDIIWARDVLKGATLSALAGTVGEAAARDLEAMVHLDDQLPRIAEVLATPNTAMLPATAGAYFLMAFKLAQGLADDNYEAIMQYTERWEQHEASALFILTVARSPVKLKVATKHTGFTMRAASIGRDL